MEDDLDSLDDERSIELSSIEAIYPELRIDPENPFAATLDIPVAPEKPLKIYFRSSPDTALSGLPTPPTSAEKEDEKKVTLGISAAAAQVDIHELSHLPPVTCTITLPSGYPSSESPKIGLVARPRWIPNPVLKALRDDCDRLWHEIGKDQVIFMYIDHLQQAAEQAFGVALNGEKRFELPGDLKLALLDYDLQVKRERYEKETFDCGICLEPKKGAKCHRLLLCGDVFCIACLQDFYNNCITEGDIDNVKCLSPTCGKEEKAVGTNTKRRRHDRTLNPSELLQIPLDQETVQRYVRLKRKKKLEADKNTIYCPRQWCQGAARSKKHPKPTDLLNDFESETEPEDVSTQTKKQNKEDIPMSDRLCICEDCNFAFCSVCKKGWHGELARCNPRRQAELNAEEQASLDYMQKFSTACPTCNAPSQKTYGCNHMICFKCKTHFCYLCSSYLMPDNPYRHFNELKSTCYMRLWELEGGDGADAGQGFAGGEGRGPAWEPEDFDSDADSEGDLDDDGDVDFDGDLILLADDEDDSDDEAVPDQRRPERNMHIEIVNFAQAGANRRIELPERPRANNAPPPAPNPPRRHGQGQQGNRHRRMANEPNRRREVNDRAQGGRPVAVRALIDELEPRNLPPAAPGQGNAAQMPAPVRAMGLERFLELARQDQEDEWDSDELDDDEDEPRAARV